MANVELVLSRIAENIKQLRLSQNLSQQQVAEQAGISRRTLVDAETGHNVSLITLIKVLFALGAVDRLDSLTSQTPISPIEVSKLKGKQRQRASGQRATHTERDSRGGGSIDNDKSDNESSDDEWTW